VPIEPGNGVGPDMRGIIVVVLCIGTVVEACAFGGPFRAERGQSSVSIYAPPGTSGQNPLRSRPSTIPADLVIELSRGACQAACPTYSLRVDANGVVTYGTEYGYPLRTGRVETAHVLELLNAFYDVRFFEMKARIDDCPVYISDVQAVSVALQAGGVRKQVWDDVECPRAEGLEALRRVEADVDRLLEPSQWLQ